MSALKKSNETWGELFLSISQVQVRHPLGISIYSLQRIFMALRTFILITQSIFQTNTNQIFTLELPWEFSVWVCAVSGTGLGYYDDSTKI